MPTSSSTALTRDLRLLAPFWREPVTRTVLPNGLTLIVKPDHSAPLASVQVWVKTGSIHEGQQLGAGLSHYLEHMLFKGTERRAGREISATVQSHGGYINAYTTFDRTVYYIDLPSEHVAVAIDLLGDAVLHSTLPAGEVEKEKNVILREIDMGRDDPDHRLTESLFDTAFRQHPYRYPIIGYRDVFAALTREDLVAYYQARYVPNNLVVVVVGSVDPAAIEAEVAKHFGAVPRSRLAPVLVLDEPVPLAPRELHRREDVEITRAGLAWQIPGLDHPDAPFLDVLASLLGGGDSSILWQEIREKAQLVHQIDAASWNPGSVGLFYVSLTCEPGKREAATAAIHRTLERVARTGFKNRDLQKVLRQLVVGEINTRKTMSGQASRLGAAEVVVGDLAFAQSYFERLARVNSQELVRVLRTYLVPTRLTSVSLNPVDPAATVSAESLPSVASRSGFEEVTLPNGARLLLQKDARLPSVHLRLAVSGGPAAEQPGRRGATALLTTLLTKDTQSRTAAEVAQAVEEVGGSFSPFSGNNTLGVAVEMLSSDADRALELLADAILTPTFAAKTFAIERDAQVAELQQDADDVVTYGRKATRRRFFGDHPLALDPQGDLADVKALTREDVRALHRRLFVSHNVVLAVAGDFPRGFDRKLKAFLRRLPEGPAFTSQVPFKGPREVGEFVERQPREQAVVFQAFPGPGVLDSDHYVAEVADELFSGMASRLFERVREDKGLAYFVRSSRVIGVDTGMFYFYAGTAPVHGAEVLAEIEAEIDRVASGGVEPVELSRCQARLKAGKRQSLQTNGSRAMQAALNCLYGLPVNDWQHYDQRIDEVTIKALATFARQRLKRAQRVQLVVQP